VIGEWRLAEAPSQQRTLVSGPKLYPITTGALLGLLYILARPIDDDRSALAGLAVGATVGLAFSVAVWLGRWNRIELDQDGFTEIAFGIRQQRVPWRDCAVFFLTGPTRSRWHHAGFHRYSLLTGLSFDNAIPLSLKSNYGLSADRLVDMMNDFRQRASAP
jgi:hypothetical protein